MSTNPTPATIVAINGAQQRIHPRDASAWVFDLDNTLYSGAYGLFSQIDARMKSYVGDFLDVSPDEAFRVQKSYFREYGTTLRGMMVRHDMDPEPFLDFVHDIDVSVIPPNPALDLALERIDAPKVIFTNATKAHAGRVMDQLGVAEHFAGILDIFDTDYVPKPDPAVYAMIAQRFGFDPTSTVMVEDIARNLEPAQALGMTTVWVRTPSDCEVCAELPDGDHVDFEIDDLVGWLDSL